MPFKSLQQRKRVHAMLLKHEFYVFAYLKKNLFLHPPLLAAGVITDLFEKQEWPHRGLPVSRGGS